MEALFIGFVENCAAARAARLAAEGNTDSGLGIPLRLLGGRYDPVAGASPPVPTSMPGQQGRNPALKSSSRPASAASVGSNSQPFSGSVPRQQAPGPGSAPRPASGLAQDDAMSNTQPDLPHGPGAKNNKSTILLSRVT